MTTWLSIFPKPLIQSYRYSNIKNTVSTEMETGLIRKRRRFSTNPVDLSVSFIMTSDIFAVFEGWYQNDAKCGSELVTMPLKNGVGVADTEVRILEPYTASLSSDHLWSVTMRLRATSFSLLSSNSSIAYVNLLENNRSISELRTSQQNLMTSASDLIDLANSFNDKRAHGMFNDNKYLSDLMTSQQNLMTSASNLTDLANSFNDKRAHGMFNNNKYLSDLMTSQQNLMTSANSLTDLANTFNDNTTGGLFNDN